MLRIKLVRQGKKDRPTWRVIVVEKHKTGKGNFTDAIGSYNPFGERKSFILDIEKFEKYVKNGAQPTDSVLRLKGRYIDKNKDYQKLVVAKNYKSKKPIEEQKNKKTEQPKAEEASKQVSKPADKQETQAEQEQSTVDVTPAETATEPEAPVEKQEEAVVADSSSQEN